MSVYAGLDTSLDTVAICVIAETGEMVWLGTVLGDPDDVTAALQRSRDDLVRVGLEAGATSEWISGHLVDEGFPVVCLESRHVKAALGAMTVKTDRNDAQGIAQIARTGWFKAVHLKSVAGQRLRTLTAARKAAVRAVIANEQIIRGLLRSLGQDWRRHARWFRGKGSTAVRSGSAVAGYLLADAQVSAREPGGSAPPRPESGSSGSHLPSPHHHAWHRTRHRAHLQGNDRSSQALPPNQVGRCVSRPHTTKIPVWRSRQGRSHHQSG